MKKFLKLFLAITIMSFVVSCTTVESGHKGVEISWGGETNMEQILSEGMNSGIHWLWDDVIEYNVREQTVSEKFVFNDKNNMTTPVEVSVDFKLRAEDVNKLHRYVADWKTKLNKTIKSAAKEVVPQYSAVELNIHKRNEAETKLAEILSKELPDFYVEFVRVQITDVDLPASVAQLAEATAKQIEKNKLAEKKEAEKVALAKATVAEAKGEFEAAEYKAKAREILSTPKMIELQKVENDRIKWEGFRTHGKSPYGNNNIYGSETSVIKGLK